MAAYALSHRLTIEVVAIDGDAVVALAENTGLTAYDASYLWLARELRADLVTLDAALAAASAM
jgi:predicted nucleic acid-binding protein